MQNHTKILKEYLESQKPPDGAEEKTAFLDHVMQTWSFASQSNNDSLLSGVPAVLALFLKTISDDLQLSEYGLLLCKTLLQKRQLELIARGLTTNSAKGFIISPTLRLLKEVASFDGGRVIGQLYKARDYTFKALARNLGIRGKTDAIEDLKKPSVRTNAVRFLLTCIQFLSGDRKKELCHQRDVIAALTRSLNLDHPVLIEEILKTLKTHIIQDKILPRDAKNRVLNSASLGRIVSLYNYQYITKEGEKPISVDAVAHGFLISACTTPDIGILHRQRGHYPRGVNADDGRDLEGDRTSINLGLDSIEWANKFKDNVTVQNTILSDFIKSLRPWSNIKQSELLLAIFRAAPELVADYYFSKKDFSFDPKLTATWIGYSALIFSTISLPLPEFFGHKNDYAVLPPPTSVVVESILPAPVNQRALTRCLSHKSDLIRFFGVRLLIIALQKLRDALAMYRVASDGRSKVWTQAKDRLVDEFCGRCPAMKDVLIAFRNMSKSNLLQREAASKLLVLYYEVVPQIALDAKLDISGSLIEALEFSKEIFARGEEAALQAMITEHLFEVANYSPGMRWFAKVEPLNLSPFIAMLQQTLSTTPTSKLNFLLRSIASENQILQFATKQSSANALLAGFNASEAGTVATFEFLDNCVLRCSTSPIKYFDQLEKFYSETHGKEYEHKIRSSPLSLLLIVIVEQWPFLVKSKDDSEATEVARFISYYLAASMKIGEDEKVLKLLVKRLVEDTPKDSPCQKILGRSQKLAKEIEIPEYASPTPQEKPSQTTGVQPDTERTSTVDAMLQQSQTSLDNNALTRWVSKDVEEVVDDGHAAALVMLLCSPNLSIRIEALTNLSKLATKIKASTYEEKDQIWLLLCEVMESGRPQVGEHPLPTPIAAFAAQAIPVLADPSHFMYPKINKFLSQGPKWEWNKLPLMHNVLQVRPSLDDARTAELEWLLSYMIIGLSTKDDMGIYHKRRVFEKVMSLYNNAYIHVKVKEKIILLLFKAVQVESGSDTLITRFSGMSWLSAQAEVEGSGGEAIKKLKVLLEELNRTSDEKRVRKWMNGRGSAKGVKDTV